MASVRERAGGWRIEWRRGGRNGSRESCTFPTEPLAESARRLAEARGHRVTDAEVYAAVLGLSLDGAEQAAPTVAELARSRIEARRGSGAAQADTITDQNRIIVRHILPFMGELPVTDQAITDDTIAGWVRWIRGRESARGGRLDADTIRRAHEVLRSLLGVRGAAVAVNQPGRAAGQARHRPAEGHSSRAVSSTACQPPATAWTLPW